ncbi:uncharacterized protein C20orf96 homolog [Macrotis lagotis]|uniref:uncharacterized protein C20orf96 homolog n=1 Tax=Macrotis lagotis TaxID=92651 RepID=UPI003D68224D
MSPRSVFPAFDGRGSRPSCGSEIFSAGQVGSIPARQPSPSLCWGHKIALGVAPECHTLGSSPTQEQLRVASRPALAEPGTAERLAGAGGPGRLAAWAGTWPADDQGPESGPSGARSAPATGEGALRGAATGLAPGPPFSSPGPGSWLRARGGVGAGLGEPSPWKRRPTLAPPAGTSLRHAEREVSGRALRRAPAAASAQRLATPPRARGRACFPPPRRPPGRGSRGRGASSFPFPAPPRNGARSPPPPLAQPCNPGSEARARSSSGPRQTGGLRVAADWLIRVPFLFSERLASPLKPPDSRIMTGVNNQRSPKLNLPQIKEKTVPETLISRRFQEDIKKKASTGAGSVSISSVIRNQPHIITENEKNLEKIQANIQVLRTMLKFRGASLDELKSHITSLTNTNLQLAEKIQELEAKTAEKVRRLLQQQDMFGTLIGTLDYACQKQVQDMKSKLEKWETKAKNRVNELLQQLTKVRTKIHKAQEELNFLNNYMDQEYPIKSLQIVDLMREIQDVKISHQEDLEELDEIRSNVLQTLSQKLNEKSEEILHVLAKKTIIPYEAALREKALSNQRLLKQMVHFRGHINHLKKELPKLKAQVEDLQMQRKDSWEVAFADVLLRKPKCTPDMDVILNIPEEEMLPF